MFQNLHVTFQSLHYRCVSVSHVNLALIFLHTLHQALPTSFLSFPFLSFSINSAHALLMCDMYGLFFFHINTITDGGVAPQCDKAQCELIERTKEFE